MNFLDIFGNTKVSISDSLFNKNNVVNKLKELVDSGEYKKGLW